MPIVAQVALVLLPNYFSLETNFLCILAYFVVFSVMTPFYLSSLIGSKLRMDELEVVCVSLFLGSAVIMTVYILLTQALAEVSRSLLLSVLTGLSLCSYLLSIKYGRRSLEEGSSMGKVLDVFAAYLSVLTGAYLIIRVIPSLYWRGPDGWETASVVRTIAERSLDPGTTISYFYGYVHIWNAGFYYYLAAIQLITGATVENMLRYGGTFSAGALCFVTYVVVRRMAGSLAALLSGLLLFTNPMYLTRFVTPLREGYGFSLLILAFLFVKARGDVGDKRPNTTYICVMGFILASSVVVHILPSLFLIAVLALYTLYYWLRKESSLMVENLYILLASIVFIGYYAVYLEESLAWFVGVVMEGGVFLLLIPASAIIITWYASRAAHGPEAERYISLAVLLSLIVVFTDLFLTSGKSGPFNDLSMNPFSGVILFIGLFELLTNLEKVPPFASSIIMATGFFTVFSYVGVTVPLERFSQYLSWVATYLCVSFLSRLLNANWVHVSSLREVRLLKNMRPEAPLLVVLVLATSLGGALQTPHYPYYFDEAEIADTRAFNALVQEGDLVIPQETLRHLLYYTGTSYDSLVTGKDYWKWMIPICTVDTPEELSHLVETIYPGKTRAVFFSTTNRYMMNDPWVNRTILEGYCREHFVGRVKYYTMDIPYVRNNLPAEKIRGVTVSLDEPVITTEEAVTSISNVFRDREDRRRLLYATGSGLWSASSLDGAAWTLEGVRVLDGAYLSPYLVECGGEYHLFAEDPLSGAVAHYASQDTYLWESLGGFDPPPESLYYRAESPVAWTENGTMRVMFWETAVTGDAPLSGLRCLETGDGRDWREADLNTDWRLITDDYFAIEHVRILLSEAFSSGGDTVFIGRCLSRDADGSHSWSLGAFKPDLESSSKRVFFTPIAISPSDSSGEPLSCRVWRDADAGELDFYILFEGEPTGVYEGRLGD